MGAYLSTPCTEKESSDEKNDELICGASSMQGWRINQEDAHNCELNFDKDASFFAVYDGHGGPEIALYCSKYLPEFLKSSKAYADGDFEQALKDAFLGFDAKLLLADVIEELKVLAGDKYGNDEDGQDTDSDEDLAELKQEGGMPIEAVLSKYRNMVVKKNPLDRVKDGECAGSSSSSSSSSGLKPQSPCLRAKKQAIISASNGGENPSEEAAVSSSSNSDKQAVDAETSSAVGEGEGSSSAAAVAPGKVVKEEPTVSKPMESPDSSSVDAKVEGSSPATTSPTTGNGVSSSSSNAAAAGGSSSSALSSTADEVVATTGAGSSSSTVNGNGEETLAAATSSSSTGGISSTNIVRESKRVALEVSKAIGEESEEGDSDEEDEKDMTYNENNSLDSDSDEMVDDDDEDEDDEEEEEEEEDEDEDGEDDDAFISNMVEEPGKDSGCTAVVAFRHGRMLYVANAGDSRCVLSRSGEVIEMSFDHKPEDQEEYTRIEKAGGRVTMDGRVNGGLNLSRAIGDHAYKMNAVLPAEAQMISALPDVKKIELTDADDFMVLACDGIWNFMSSEAVIQFVKKRLDKGETKLSKICEELFDFCLAKDTTGDGTGCDNMTAIIVRFKWPEKEISESADAAPALEVGLKRAASSSPLPVPEIAEAEADGGLKAKRAKTEVVSDANAPTTTS